MTNEQKKTLSLIAAYEFGAAHGLAREVNEIRKMEIEWDSKINSSLRRGYIIDLFEKNGIFEEFKSTHWERGNTREGETKKRRYLGYKKQYEDFLAGRSPELEDGPEGEDQEDERQFAAESDLRDFLAKNPDCIEKGLRLYQIAERTGVEYPVDGGYIDILAVDENGRYVVIELKVAKGRSKAIGQLLYYMGWVDKNLGNAPCRGIIIAKEIPDDLILATQRVFGVSLYRYNLSVSVEYVSGKS